MKVKTQSKYSHTEKNVRAVLALIVLGLVFAIWLLFNNYKESVIASGMFELFMVLIFAGAGLLLVLLYLADRG